MKEIKRNLVLKCSICQKEIFIFSWRYYEKNDNFNHYVCYRCSGGKALYGLERLDKNYEEYNKALAFVHRKE